MQRNKDDWQAYLNILKRGFAHADENLHVPSKLMRVDAFDRAKLADGLLINEQLKKPSDRTMLTVRTTRFY